ncbi:MAG: thioredoxin domain-containing protein [Bacteroidota bacterium]
MRRIVPLLTGCFFLFLVIACQSQTHQSMDAKDHLHTNRLIETSSPYLLQHAHNPVDWYPWGEEALAKAQKENKLLLISIGYAACHWCHVMEHESFEDTAVAAIMNKYFVPIKVDREERPDVDQIYMNAALLTTGRGGWPLNAFALPDGKPFFAGTYFPKDQWVRVLEYFADLQANRPEELLKNAAKLTEGLQQMEYTELVEAPSEFTLAQATQAFESTVSKIDMRKGGLDRAPKFPMPAIHEFLLDYHYYTQNKQALAAVKVTLDEMAMGGIYDQVGGGFARYSTDAIWKVPHFEKMLYDNGQLVSLYAQAFQLTQDPYYEEIVRETLTFIERELTDENGGFYSSLDADSEGEEGKFYVWDAKEIEELLGKDAAAFSAYYNVEERGNWEGSNILFITETKEKVAQTYGITVSDLEEVIKKGKKVLLAARAHRIRPGLDDKILTSWNALMLKGYVDAYKALGDRKYLETALKNADFLVRNQFKSDGSLYRNFKDGTSAISAFADDYSLLIEAFVALYQATFDAQWLEKAAQLMEYALAHFYDASTGTFFYTSDLDDPLVSRTRELSDNVIPGSNSSFTKGLFLLGTYLYKQDYLDKSTQLLSNAMPNLAKEASFFASYGSVLLHYVYPPYEVAIVGDNYEELRKEMDLKFIPRMFLLGGKEEGKLELLQQKKVPGETYIYVCQDKACKLPVKKVADALKQIE